MSPQRETATAVAGVLARYGGYVARLDDFCMKLREKYWEAISCRPGCTECCAKELTVFPIEAARIRGHIESLSRARRGRIASHLEAFGKSGATTPCPLLLHGRCLIYPARPLLCRTEGFALAHRGEAASDWRVTACPKNFTKRDLESDFPPKDLINLESLNQSLVVLNHAYLNAARWSGEERVRLSRVLGSGA